MAVIIVVAIVVAGRTSSELQPLNPEFLSPLTPNPVRFLRPFK